MDWQRIEELIGRYWEAETTPAEEAELRQALQQPDVPAHMQKEAVLMVFWTAERATTLSPERDQALRQITDRKPQAGEGKSITFRINSLWVRVAATVVIAAGLYLYSNRPGTPSDPMQAFASLNHEGFSEQDYDEVRDALLFISLKFNKGAEPMENLAQLQQVNEPLQHLDKFNRASEILELNN